LEILGFLSGGGRLSDYEILKARIGKIGADRAVAYGFIKPPEASSEYQEHLPLLEPETRVVSSPKQKPSRESQFGQFMTSRSVAGFMAGLFGRSFPESVRLLDPGAGKGALTTAFVAHWRHCDPVGRLEAHAYEFDSRLLDELRANLAGVSSAVAIEANVLEGDFIERAATMIRLGRGKRFTHAILNPPYKKINSASAHRSLLRAVGLETVNLYSGFVGLAVELMEDGGNIVAIIPRSFCNGPYYQPFRDFVLGRTAIRHIHLFEARNKAFKDDGVLQENIIIRLERGRRQGAVTVSTSTDDTFSDYFEQEHSFQNIVIPDDAERFIHIPTGDDTELLNIKAIRYRLDELGLSVSTGPVVDFRMKDDLRSNPQPGTVPLLYPGHFKGGRIEWPKPGFKKPNAIRHTRDTTKWLFPGGFYTVVRRFSSKEERRRIVANVVDPADLPASMFGFENHLNVIHANRQPLPENLARGIAVYLNATLVDQYFRRFNGHTQVNAADLRIMKYPSRETLNELGVWAKSQSQPTQDAIDARVSSIA
jgi:adenine-specific DNA-methyltransferase